jgi:hypothetical protein
MLRAVPAEQAELICQAVATERPLAYVTRATGVALASVLYRLRRPVL